jgi:hypothetical protein
MTPTAQKRVGAGAAGASAVYGSVLRPRMQWLGTSHGEQTATYPGDDLIPGGRRYGAMATMIAGPPECVWPWLVQMGCDRAGFYSFDRLDNRGRPSAERIHAEWQNLREGDRIASAPDASRWFDVALVVPERTLVLRASVSIRRRATSTRRTDCQARTATARGASSCGRPSAGARGWS